MPQEKSYNGWTNYDTWSLKFWIDNDESIHCFWAARADDCFSAADDSENFTKIENATFTLADELENYYYENLSVEVMEEMGIKVESAKILNAGLRKINWHEIAESLLEDVEK